MTSITVNTNGAITVVTVPASTDTAVALATIDTLTNKTISGGSSGNTATVTALGSVNMGVSASSAYQTMFATGNTMLFASVFATFIFGSGSTADPNLTVGTLTLAADTYYAALTIAA